VPFADRIDGDAVKIASGTGRPEVRIREVSDRALAG
jgi:hypothetical protein